MMSLVQSWVPDLFSFGVEMAFRASAVLAGTLLLSFLLRRSSASLRHALWSVTLLALLALPAVWAFGPTLAVPGWSVADASGEAAAPKAAAAMESLRAPVTGASGPVMNTVDEVIGSGGVALPLSDFSSPEMASISESSAESGSTLRPNAPRGMLHLGQATLVLIWLTGQILALLALAQGVWRARRALATSTPVADAAWLFELDRARFRTGVTRTVELRIGPMASTPMAGGMSRPFILLPESAHEWTADRRELVLLHEMIHVRRLDATRQLLGRLAAAFYWFNPLVWLASRMSVLAREEACDEAIIVMGHRPSAYARHLLELAAPTSLPLPALSIQRRPHLEKRLMSILKTNSRPRPWAVSCIAVVASFWALTVAAAAPSSVLPQEAPDVTPEVPAAIETPVPVPSVTEPVPTVAASIESAPTAPLALPVLPSANATPLPSASTAPVQAVSCPMEGVEGSFRGTISTSTTSAGERVVEAMGYRNGDRVIQKRTPDGSLCLWAHGTVDLGEDLREISYISAEGWVVMAERVGERLLQLEVYPQGEGFEYRWSIDGSRRDFGSTEAEWRDAMLEVLSSHWEISRVRGQASSLRGRISSIRGERSSLKGKISSIRGRVSSLKGKISSTRGQRSSLRGRISSIKGHVSSLRGRISSTRGQESSLRGRISSIKGRISGLSSAARSTGDEETRFRLEREISLYEARIAEVQAQIESFDTESRVREIELEIESYGAESKIREVEAQIAAHDTDGKVAEIEAQIDEYDVFRRVAEVEAQLAMLDVEGRVEKIQQEIEALNVDQQIRELETRLELQMEWLRDVTLRLLQRPA